MLLKITSRQVKAAIVEGKGGKKSFAALLAASRPRVIPPRSADDVCIMQRGMDAEHARGRTSEGVEGQNLFGSCIFERF